MGLIEEQNPAYVQLFLFFTLSGLPMLSPRSPRQLQLEKFVARLGLVTGTGIRWDLMELALTHPSADSVANYEQLEFLGDSVVRLVASRQLWQTNQAGTVGEWSAVRSVLVSDRTLAEIALSVGLEQFLRVGASAVGDRKGETSRLADSFEAVLGALFLSDQTLGLILPWFEPILERFTQKVRTDPAYQNYKAALQQWTQLHHKILPEYRVQSLSDAVHDPKFAAEVWLLGKCYGSGEGRSRKAAEKAAAQVAYKALAEPEGSV